MDRNSCQKWLERDGWGDTPRSACIGCPYHNDHLWRQMKEQDPGDWQEAVDFDNKLREQRFLKTNGDGLVYTHKTMQPLDMVDLSTAEERGQLNLFGNECTGLCGV